MASSDAFADEILTLAATAGGSWWLGILESRPQTAAELAAAVADVAPIAPVEIVREVVSWSTAAGRLIYLDADVVLPASTGTCSPAAWCLFADEAMTDPVLCGWLADALTGPLSVGSVLKLPASTVALVFPDKLTVLP